MLLWACGALICWGLMEPSVGAGGANYLVCFDREHYAVKGGETFPVHVMISPPPSNGLYSFGVRLSVPPTNAAITGVGAIQVPSSLSFDGPRSFAPVVEVSSNFAAVKGTVSFYSPDLQPVSSNILVTFYITDLAPGPYRLDLSFYNTLGQTEQIFVDGQGVVLDPDIAFASAMVQRAGAVAAGVAGPLSFNRQTGLFEQDVYVTNSLSITIAGVRLIATGLPPTWTLRNAAGTTNGLPYLVHSFPLRSGESVRLRVQYHVPDRHGSGQPQYLPEPLTGPELPGTPNGLAVSVNSRASLKDGSFLLEFDTLADHSYAVQYAEDGTNWITVAPALRGTGSRVQWIDYGPPKTKTPPGTDTQRFYRLILLP